MTLLVISLFKLYIRQFSRFLNERNKLMLQLIVYFLNARRRFHEKAMNEPADLA